jgi:starvation-inducible DNA-binding protein
MKSKNNTATTSTGSGMNSRRTRARVHEEETLDKTLADSFPASDPLSSIPDPDAEGQEVDRAEEKENHMNKSTERRFGRAEPLLKQRGQEVQPYGSLMQLPIGLDEDTRRESVKSLNQILCDTMTLRDMYKKHHWQVAGPTFYQLHLLFDKHYEEQAKLVDIIAERIQSLGGISIAMAHDVAEMTHIQRPPCGREEVPVQISRLLEAHEIILREARQAAKKAEESEDAGTNDLLVSDVIRANEMQVWFVAEHVVDLPVVQARSA